MTIEPASEWHRAGGAGHAAFFPDAAGVWRDYRGAAAPGQGILPGTVGTVPAFVGWPLPTVQRTTGDERTPNVQGAAAPSSARSPLILAALAVVVLYVLTRRG